MRKLHEYEILFVAGGSRWTRIRDIGVEVLKEVGVPVEKIENEVNRIIDRRVREGCYCTYMHSNDLDYYEKRQPKSD